MERRTRKTQYRRHLFWQKTSDKIRTDTKNGKIRCETAKQTERKYTMQILRATELDTNTQVSGDRNKLQ